MVSVCLPSDALSQCLPSYLGFSYFGHGVSPQLFQQSAATDPYLGHGVAPVGCHPWPWMWGSSSRPLLYHLSLRTPVLSQPWSNRQIWPWNTEWSRAKANRVLPRKRTGHSEHPLPTQKRRLYRWTSPDGQHQNEIDYILCCQRWRSSIQPAKTRPGADCGSDHEFLMAKFRLKLKEIGKITTPFKYDVNQIPKNYTVKWDIDLREQIW